MAAKTHKSKERMARGGVTSSLHLNLSSGVQYVLKRFTILSPFFLSFLFPLLFFSLLLFSLYFVFPPHQIFIWYSFSSSFLALVLSFLICDTIVCQKFQEMVKEIAKEEERGEEEGIWLYVEELSNRRGQNLSSSYHEILTNLWNIT